MIQITKDGKAKLRFMDYEQELDSSVDAPKLLTEAFISYFKKGAGKCAITKDPPRNFIVCGGMITITQDEEDDGVFDIIFDKEPEDGIIKCAIELAYDIKKDLELWSRWHKPENPGMYWEYDRLRSLSYRSEILIREAQEARIREREA